VFFVEAHLHHNPKRASGQVRYIAHREEGLPEGKGRELYGIGPRYRAFRGDAKAMQRVPEASRREPSMPPFERPFAGP